jgi:hypothetical protein
MATLGRIWQQTEEHARAELYTFMYNAPLTLPADEFDFVKRRILYRIPTMLKVHVSRPMINNPSAKFLWVLYNRLDPVQKQAILADDTEGAIAEWGRNFEHHPAAYDHMADPRNWVCYYSTQRYLEYVRNITNPDYYDLYPSDKISVIFKEFAQDPRRAYCNNEAIQWTGANRDDIELYYGKHFKTSFDGGDLIIHTGVGDQRLKVGDWTWPDTTDGIDGGDYLYLMRRRAEAGIPGIWFKPE